MIGATALPRERRLQFAAALAVGLAAALALGWQSGQAPGSVPPAAATDDWTLPQIVAPDAARDAALLAARHPWGGGTAFGDPEAAPPSAAPPRWRLVGVIERGDEHVALVLIGDGPAAKLEYRALGDSLPDGSVLVQIGADSATSEGGKSAAAERRVHRLFEKAR